MVMAEVSCSRRQPIPPQKHTLTLTAELGDSWLQYNQQWKERRWCFPLMGHGEREHYKTLQAVNRNYTPDLRLSCISLIHLQRSRDDSLDEDASIFKVILLVLFKKHPQSHNKPVCVCMRLSRPINSDVKSFAAIWDSCGRHLKCLRTSRKDCLVAVVTLRVHVLQTVSAKSAADRLPDVELLQLLHVWMRSWVHLTWTGRG